MKKTQKKKSRKSKTRKRQLRSSVRTIITTFLCALAGVALSLIVIALHDKPITSTIRELVPSITQQVNSEKYVTVVRFSGEVVGSEETEFHNEMLWAGAGEDDISPPEVTNWGIKLREALSDTNCIFAIAVINSGGGSIEASMSVAHTFKTLQVLCDKPVFAYSNRGLFSGAYMVAVTCPIIGMSPAAMTGSIGVFWLYENDVGYFEKKGITFDIIKSGEHKISTSPINTLTPEQRKVIQDLVDSAHEDFLNLIIENRKTQFEKIFGSARDTLRVICDGRPYSAQIALKHGFVDFVGYYDEFVQVLYEFCELDDDVLLKENDSTFVNIHGEEVKR